MADERIGAKSHELDLLALVREWGVQAIYGRPLGAGEIKRMRAAEQVVQGYRSRLQSENWAAWAEANPYHANLLGAAASALEME